MITIVRLRKVLDKDEYPRTFHSKENNYIYKATSSGGDIDTIFGAPNDEAARILIEGFGWNYAPDEEIVMQETHSSPA